MSSLPTTLKTVLNNTGEVVADTLALEVFIREELMVPLEKALKQREHKLKKVRLPTPSFLLSKFNFRPHRAADKTPSRASLKAGKYRQELYEGIVRTGERTAETYGSKKERSLESG